MPSAERERIEQLPGEERREIEEVLESATHASP
jgi:hypothetical protein